MYVDRKTSRLLRSKLYNISNPVELAEELHDITKDYIIYSQYPNKDDVPFQHISVKSDGSIICLFYFTGFRRYKTVKSFLRSIRFVELANTCYDSPRIYHDVCFVLADCST